MRFLSKCCALLSTVAALVSVNVDMDPSATGASSPINKVVALLTEMKAQTEKEAREDQEAYDKYKCWCITTEKEKTEAIEAAKKLIDSLNAFVQEAAGKEGELKTEIAGLADDIAKDKDALASATAVRADENKAFLSEQADLKETLDLLSQAIAVLSKVQLVQKSKGRVAGARAEAQALVQVRALVRRFKSPGKFNNVIMKDLFDMLGSFQGPSAQGLRAAKAGAFLGQAGRDGSLPWIKSDEQIGKEANPNDLKGAAAGAKSYNSRSGRILGVLKEMGDENAKDLATAQKEELQAEIDFQNLQAAKLGEIAAATEQKEQKEAALADLLFKVARAKHDIEQTQHTLDADEKFLLEMTENCKVEDEEYANRVKVRSEEIKALGETLNILTGDEARSLFDKTISFLQLGSVSQSNSTRAAAQEKAATRAMQRIVEVARKHRNWQLASLAVRVKLDAFTKVKEVMDKLLAELKAQQKEEYEKWETCKKDIDQTEDKIKEEEQTKADLADKHKELTNTLETLAKQIADLEAEVTQMEVSLKQAGEQRKAQNQLYQTTMADQRATVQILKMASARLEKFYGFAEVNAHAGVAPPPPKPKVYQRQANSGGVMQLLEKIITDAESVEIEIKMGEQKAQEEYAAFASATTASIEADRQAIQGAKEATASAESSKSETEEAQLANEETLKQLGELLKSTHMDCDFVLKYFDIRQKARAEEMDAIEDAKAILSGADFS
mmetsp:Transcript_13405/g.22044  ORF Transcript_13405/g.22044 Transcript_13405/m.22044 type:complete len:728 (-) Transcript_13405:58-2241(-)